MLFLNFTVSGAKFQPMGGNVENLCKQISEAYFFIDIIILEIYNIYNYILNGNDREK